MVTWITQEKEGTHRNVITDLNYIVATCTFCTTIILRSLFLHYFTLELGP